MGGRGGQAPSAEALRQTPQFVEAPRQVLPVCGLASSFEHHASVSRRWLFKRLQTCSCSASRVAQTRICAFSVSFSPEPLTNFSNPHSSQPAIPSSTLPVRTP